MKMRKCRASRLMVGFVNESGVRVLRPFLHQDGFRNQPRGIHEFLRGPHLQAGLVDLEDEISSTLAQFNAVGILQLPLELVGVSRAPIEASRDVVWEYLLGNMSFPMRVDFWTTKQIAKECVVLPLGYGHPIFDVLRDMVAPFIPGEK